MPITITVDSTTRQVVATMVGPIGIADLLNVAVEHRTGDRRAWAVIYDMSDALVDLSSDDVRRAADRVSSDDRTAPIGPAAIVAPSPETFGLGRMFQSYSVLLGRKNVGVFHAIADARAWLANLQS
jgi:hypothetical protein